MNTTECKIQNAKYFGMMKCKMPIFFMGVFSSIQNFKVFMVLVVVGTGSQALLGFLGPLEAKIQNGE